MFLLGLALVAASVYLGPWKHNEDFMDTGFTFWGTAVVAAIGAALCSYAVVFKF